MKKHSFLILLLLAFTLTGCPHSNGTDTPAAPEKTVPTNPNAKTLPGSVGENPLVGKTYRYVDGDDYETVRFTENTIEYTEMEEDVGLHEGYILNYSYDAVKNEIYMTVQKQYDDIMGDFLELAGKSSEENPYYFTWADLQDEQFLQDIANVFGPGMEAEGTTLADYNEGMETNYASWTDIVKEMLSDCEPIFNTLSAVKYTIDENTIAFTSILPPDATAEAFLKGEYQSPIFRELSFRYQDEEEVEVEIISDIPCEFTNPKHNNEEDDFFGEEIYDVTDSTFKAAGETYSYTADFATSPKTITVSGNGLDAVVLTEVPVSPHLYTLVQ